MPDVPVDPRTYEKLRFSAALMNRPVGDVIRILVERLAERSGTIAHPDVEQSSASDDVQPTRSTQDSAPEWLPVYSVYKQRRFDGEFNPSSMQLRILEEPWSGEVFASPTAAAQAVVAHVPGNRQTNNTNGRRFWRLSSGGGDLRAIVGERF